MQDYKESNKKSKYMEDKYFDNLLTSYYEDYNKLKNKYNFKDESDINNNIDIDEKEYLIKKQNIDKLFTGDLLDIQDFNFDFCDNLINDIPKDNNYALLKTTQNKEDYELRLQGFIKNKKYGVLNEEKIEDENEEEDKVNIKAKDSEDLKKNIDNNINNNKINENDIKNNTSENNINNIAINENEEKESIGYIEDNQQFQENNDNYLKLTQKKSEEELPLFSDIISSNYNKNYKVPTYNNNEDEIVKKPKEEKNSNYEKEIEDENENRLILINKNREKMKFEDIISSDFEKDYKIPEYNIPNDVIKELKKEEKENNNITNNNNNLKEVNNIIKNNEEEGALIDAESVKEKENNEPEPEKKVEKKNSDDNDNLDDLKEIEYDDDDKQYNDFEG